MKYLLSFFLLLFAIATGWTQPHPDINPGLLRHSWDAVWIGPRLGPGESDHGVFHFRRSFDLANKPSSFIVHVTADNRYRLFVNGDGVGLGPSRGDKIHWQFETYDLAPYLKAGKNTIAAQVWNLGDKAPVAQMTIGKTAFLMQGNTEKENAVHTDTENWKVMRNRAFGLIRVTGEMVYGYYAVGATDSIDGAEFPWGWETNEYNDAQWENASRVAAADPLYFRYKHGEADGGLTPRTIPMMEERLERIPTVVRAAGLKTDSEFLTGNSPIVIPANMKASILLDQTHLTTAYPEMVVSGGSGSSIEVAYAEALVDENRRKGNRNETENKKLVGYFDVFMPDGGQDRLFRPLWYRFRRISKRIS